MCVCVRAPLCMYIALHVNKGTMSVLPMHFTELGATWSLQPAAWVTPIIGNKPPWAIKDILLKLSYVTGSQIVPGGFHATKEA